MKYLFEQKLIGIIALLFLVGCGGGGGGSSSPALTWQSFSQFELPENSTSRSWSIPADSNKSSSISYTITGGADASNFSLQGSTLSLSLTPNYESPVDKNSDGVFEVNLSAISGNASATKTVYVKVTDVNDAPVIVTSTISTILENTLQVFTVEASDEDSNATLTYSFVDSGSSKDEGLLAIDSASGAISFALAPDYENPTDLNQDNSIVFSVTVSDGSLSSTADYSLTITNGNEAPSISTTTLGNIAENTTSITTITASDPDASSSLVFSLVDSSGLKDESLVTINASTGVLSFKTAPDYEVPTDVGSNNVIDFSIQVSDGSLVSTMDYSFSITDVQENPVFTQPSSNSYSENSGTTFSFAVADVPHSATVYSLYGTDASKFNISSAGILSFASAPDYESPSDVGLNNVYNLHVRASWGNNASALLVLISVSDDLSDNFGVALPANVAIAELKEENE